MYYNKKPGQVYIIFFFFYCLAIIYSGVFVFNGWGMCDLRLKNYELCTVIYHADQTLGHLGEKDL